MMLRRVGLVEEAKMWAGSVVVEGLVSGGVGGRFVSRSAEGDEGAAQRLRERRGFQSLFCHLWSLYHHRCGPSTKSTTTASGGYRYSFFLGFGWEGSCIAYHECCSNRN